MTRQQRRQHGFANAGVCAGDEECRSLHSRHQSGNVPFTPSNPFGHPPIEASVQVKSLRETTPQANGWLRAGLESGFVFFPAAICFDKKTPSWRNQN
jgi:hypothetical protein